MGFSLKTNLSHSELVSKMDGGKCDKVSDHHFEDNDGQTQIALRINYCNFPQLLYLVMFCGYTPLQVMFYNFRYSLNFYIILYWNDSHKRFIT